ncbi:hypothetical protein ACIA6C_14940 [Streptomyces sp. NPDC051578]|uniref:hypothetical protein n=1 Tax=Streptomyces sp. NPDC051578 TaxID=3365662 RepID=UPI0037BD71F9
MSRVPRTRNALTAAAAAAFLAVGATAAPAQAANGTISWVNGGDYRTMTVTNPAGRSCWPVGLHSYNLTNNTDEYLQAYTSTTKGACMGTSYTVSPGGTFMREFASFQVMGG